MLLFNFDLFLRKLRLQKDNELLIRRAAHSKEEKSTLEKYIVRLEEKCKNLDIKADEANKRFRSVEEEVRFLAYIRISCVKTIFHSYKNRRLSNQAETREKVFRIERTRLEKEIATLKERMNTLTMEKNRIYPWRKIESTHVNI